MHQTIRDRVCNVLSPTQPPPLIRWQLAYHHRGVLSVSVIHQFQQIVTLRWRQRLKAPIIQDKQLRF
jgi:hypothetical protein